MSEIIKSYYLENSISPDLIEKKIKRFNEHQDIAKEFELWIQNREYKNDGLCIEGYNAKDLSKKSKYLDGEGAFMMLIELREHPEKAIERLSRGFKRK